MSCSRMGIQFLKKTIPLLSVLSLLLLSSCTYLKKTDLYHLDKQNAEVEKTITQSKQDFNIGDYSRAIDVYELSFAKYPENRKLLTNYLKTLENIKSVADRAFEKKDYNLAGQTYYTLLKDYSHFKNFAKLLSFNSEFLKARVTECRTYVSRKGLEQYRKRNFREAISIWKNLLAFDPNNIYIRNAIDTATIQLKTLEGKK
jgi:tetratricopeptide (TPR) repeat protein